MKSTVAHSAVLVVMAAVALVAFRAAVHPAVHAPSPHSALLASLGAPLAAFAQLLPGLALGWFTRRHPLVVGATSGVVALVSAQWVPFLRLEPYPLVGQTVALAMTVAVAALAGRTLRRHFSPAGAPAAAL